MKPERLSLPRKAYISLLLSGARQLEVFDHQLRITPPDFLLGTVSKLDRLHFEVAENISYFWHII